MFFFEKKNQKTCGYLGLGMKLLIVDDHPVVRQGVTALVEQSWVGAVVVTAVTAAEALAAVAAHPDLDIVLLDLILPGGDGLPTIADIGRLRPDLPVLVLASSEDLGDVRTALALGAGGYVPKSSANSTLLAAIRLGLDGETYVPPLVLHAAAPSVALPQVTPRQMEVLRLLAQGLSNKAIASALALSEKTVKAHLAALFKELAAGNRTQAVAAARRAGLL
jgi:DNA-binding NarL/FixJ family response regulator